MNRYRSDPDRTLRGAAPSPGVAIVRSCLGCHRPKSTLGGKGAGVRWRCLGCVKVPA